MDRLTYKGDIMSRKRKIKNEELQEGSVLEAPPSPDIINRNGLFLQLGPRRKNLYQGSSVDLCVDLQTKKYNDLAISNNLDLQYRSVSKSKDTLTIGSISDEFLRDLSEIVGSYKFSCILYDPNKDLIAIYQWPDLDLKTFNIHDWISFKSRRLIWILGIWL